MSDTLDMEEMASLFGVTSKTIRIWVGNGLPVVTQGQQGKGHKTLIDLKAAVEWYFAENFEKAELDRQRTRLAEEQADKLALENSLRRGELVELKRYQKHLELFLSEFRAAWLGFAVKVAPRLDGDINQRKDRLESAVHEILRSIADYQPGTADGGDPESTAGVGDDSAATSETESESVGRQQAASKRRKQRRTGSVEH